MNRRLDQLHRYPFERLNDLLEDIKPVTESGFITLSLGEPKHEMPAFLLELFANQALIKNGMGAYPPTKGTDALRSAIAAFINRRYHLESAPIDAENQVLPVNGTREALFSFAQTIIDAADDAVTLIPNPFYQIYEGAAILAGSQPEYVPCTKETQFLPDFSHVSDRTWSRCKLIYICSPGNPTGAVMSTEDMQALIKLSDIHNFVIASDECYSEIYRDETTPPPGLLQAALEMGRQSYKNCIAFNSLSKRSSLPGLRSGYVAGDAELIDRFLLYRTYHGSAMSIHNQVLSEAAWNDEQHVVANRQLYRDKFSSVVEILNPVWPITAPEASFYLWPTTPIDDTDFTRKIMQYTNIKVLPGSYLSRTKHQQNPGKNHIRMALVATLDECQDAAHRLKSFIEKKQYQI